MVKKLLFSVFMLSSGVSLANTQEIKMSGDSVGEFCVPLPGQRTLECRYDFGGGLISADKLNSGEIKSVSIVNGNLNVVFHMEHDSEAEPFFAIREVIKMDVENLIKILNNNNQLVSVTRKGGAQAVDKLLSIDFQDGNLEVKDYDIKVEGVAE